MTTVVVSFRFPENEEAITWVVRSWPICCVRELIVLPWNTPKNPIPVDKVLVTKVDVNITLDVRFAEDILLAYNCSVLTWLGITAKPIPPPSPIVVDIVEIPNAKIEYSVEFVDPIDVLSVEKYPKKLDVCPIVVDNVLNEDREIFENVLKFVETEDI